MKEAFRLLKKDGVALHFIDLSDHFQQQDASIAEFNFLRYSESEWERIAGNEFAYTNRLRTSDSLSIFREVSFVVLRKNVRQGSKSELNSKFHCINRLVAMRRKIYMPLSCGYCYRSHKRVLNN